MTIISTHQTNGERPNDRSHVEHQYKSGTALFHCKECGSWWGKDVYPCNPLARYVLFLTHSFNWENYYGWHTEQGIDDTCIVCGHPNPKMFTT